MNQTKLIVNLTRGRAVCIAEMADGPLRRMRGLMGRSGLPAGEGILISPAPAIHTAFMRFAIDALFLDDELKVLEIVERLRPWRVASQRRARSVLELRAGESARCGVELGDRLELRDRAAHEARDADAAEMAERVLVTANGAAPATEPVPVILSRAPEVGAEISRLAPLHVAVLSSDRHFQSVMSLLLARRNCSVSISSDASRLSELVERERVDVVVIDYGSPRGLSSASAIRALARPVGVVLVAEEPARHPSEPVVLVKWGPFGDLMAAIEHADERRGVRGETCEQL